MYCRVSSDETGFLAVSPAAGRDWSFIPSDSSSAITLKALSSYFTIRTGKGAKGLAILIAVLKNLFTP